MPECHAERKPGGFVPCCVVGPSLRPVIPGWSRPVAVISLELFEAIACAAGEKRTDEGITERNV